MRFFLAVSAVLIAVIYLSIPHSPMYYGEERTEYLKADIKEFSIGVVWPFSTNSDFMKEGVEMAIDEVNEEGLYNQTLKAVYRDTESKKELAGKAADEFVRTTDMFAVMGHYDSEVAAEATISYEKAKMLYLNTGAFGSFLSDHNFNYFIRTSINTRMIAENLAETLSDEGYRKVYLVTQEDSYGQDLAFYFKYFIDFKDMGICRTDSYFRWETKFHEIIHDLKFEDCDIVVVSGTEPWTWQFLKDMRDMGVALPYAAASTSFGSLMKIAPKSAEGTIYYSYYDPMSDDPENIKFRESFQKRYNKLPDAYAATAYDTVKMLAEAIRQTKSLDPLNLSYYFKYIMYYNGVNGNYDFNPDGDVLNRPFYLKQVKNGKGIIIRSLDTYDDYRNRR